VFNKIIKGMPAERIMIGGIIYQKGTGMMVGILNSLFQQLGVPQISIKINAIMGPCRVVNIQIGSDIVGKYGELQTNVDKLKNTPLFFEIDLSKLSSHAVAQTQFRSIPGHPVVERDMTFKTATDVNYCDIINEIREIDKLIVNVCGVKKPYKESDNKVSITFRVTYQSPERTLKSEEVEEVEKRIIEEMANKFKMELKK
jgi:phenylalanyl-tRNA synthetase beta chain